MTPLASLTALSLLGYHLTFDAEMTTQADMSHFINTFQNGDTRLYGNNGEAENYAPYDTTNPAAPYNFGNGALTITASPVPLWGQPYTSGMIETYGLFAQSSGYFEIRATTPAGQGFWPAFWLLPTGYYPEIDILEQPNNSGTNTQYWTHTSTPTNNNGGFVSTGVDVTQGYHRYGFLWTNNTIQYVFDGNLVGWQQTLPPALVGLQMYMIANLAVGEQWSWPGQPLPGASMTYSIDYIRAFSNDPAVPAVVQQPISSPDGALTLPQLQPSTPVPMKPIGAGPDTLVLQLAEDAYAGDAQFTFSVAGKQWGGIQTVTANHSVGQSQAFTVKGNFGLASHIATLNFLNDNYGPYGDCNLYVVSATINGVPVHNAALNLLNGGPQSFGFTAKPVAPLSIGTGPDTFLFGISQVPHTGNARYAVWIDGKQQSIFQVASAYHAFGQSQAVSVNGTFGPGAHTVGVTFATGAIPGSTTDPADMYIDSLSYDGFAVPAGTIAMTERGKATIQTPPIQPDTLTLNLAEDAFQGDAQVQVSVDGTVLDTQTITASYTAGATQALTYSGSWGGSNVGHAVVVNFLNDLYAAPGQDRNVHLQSMVLDGTTVTTGTSLMTSGPVTFNYAPAAPTAGWVFTPIK